MADIETSSSSAAATTAATSSSDNYIQTATGNYVSRKARLDNPKQVALKGRSVIQPGVVMRGDLAVIRVGRFCWIHDNVTLEPPALLQPTDTDQTHIATTVGSHTMIGKDCVIQAAAIGSYCWIGQSVKLGERVILKDCCVVADGTWIPPDTVVPPFTRVSQNPIATLNVPQFLELPPSTAQELQERFTELYQDFVASRRIRKS